jgi:hypothetical protein
MEEEVSPERMREMFDNFLNATQAAIHISGNIFRPSEVLKKMNSKFYEEELLLYYGLICDKYYCKELE